MKKLLITFTSAALVVVASAGIAVAQDVARIDAVIQKVVDRMVTETGVSSQQPRKIAVSALVSLGPTARDKQMGDVVAEILQERLANVEGVTLIERVQLKKILEELKLSLLGLTDPSNAEAVGKLAGADAMIVGSVSEVGADFKVALRLVDVSTGKIEKALSVNVPQEGMIALSSDYVVVRSKSDAIFRSALVPGWGQMYNNDTVRGALYFTAVIGTAGGAVAAALLAKSTQADYDAVDLASHPEAVARQEALDGYADEYTRRRRVMNGMMFSAIGLWAVNVLDAAVTGKAYSEVEAPKVAVGMPDSTPGLQVAWRF